MVKNFWTVVEQEMYNVTGPFFWYQAGGAGLLIKVDKTVQCIWRISLKLIMFCDKLYRSKCSPQQSGSGHTVI